MENDAALTSTYRADVPDTVGARLQAMTSRSKVVAMVGAAALAGLAVAMAWWPSHADYKVLYANLADKDGGAVIAQLAQMNVPYRMAEGGAAILVPAAQVHDLRLKMATAGLPKGAVSGFELMDSVRFGQTQFQERLTFQRGLEGELTRSISSLAAVQAARVHLALPNQNGFFREQQKPSASVLLTLHAGRSLDRAQIAGIVHLVSSSVPEMSPKTVSVLDQSGALLTSSGDGTQSGGLDAQQLQYVSQVEAGYTKRIIELVEPIVGRDNLRASVTADIDFSQAEATSEEWKPNHGSEASVSIRSQQTSEQGAAASRSLQGAPKTGSRIGATARREATTSYEVDKTVRITKSASGNVKRLNAAVVVNNRTITDAWGKSVSTPLSADDLDQLTALVRESIGFSQERGDSVKVVNATFKVEPVGVRETSFWKTPEAIDLVRAAAVPAGLSLVAVLVFFGLIRPIVKNALSRGPIGRKRSGARLDEVVDDPQTLSATPVFAAPAFPKQIEGARVLAKADPAAVAGIVRGWVGSENRPGHE
ncbi:MAG: flagellar basal-body MS-ring/collar protein FliF [Caldimonas sp.]